MLTSTPGAKASAPFEGSILPWLIAEDTCDEPSCDIADDDWGGMPVLLVLSVCLSPAPPVCDDLDDLLLVGPPPPFFEDPDDLLDELPLLVDLAPDDPLSDMRDIGPPTLLVLESAPTGMRETATLTKVNRTTTAKKRI